VNTASDNGALLADTSDLRLIGDVALRAGLPIYELRQATTDLEALFFELTEGTNRNLGGMTAPGSDSSAGHERDTE
jgi:ABC-2 type transport system ATP-binding protein